MRKLTTRLRRLAVGRVAAGAILAWALAASALAQELPPARNLQMDAREAASKQLPILLFFNREDCPYCARALREFFLPMQRSGDYVGRVIFRQIEVDRPLELVGFDGSRTTHAAFAAGLKARFTPTVMVVDEKGQPLGQPIVGLLTPDFYGAYLDEAIDQGRTKMRGRRAAS
jgi:thioredoxin-related protein